MAAARGHTNTQNDVTTRDPMNKAGSQGQANKELGQLTLNRGGTNPADSGRGQERHFFQAQGAAGALAGRRDGTHRTQTKAYMEQVRRQWAHTVPDLKREG